MDTTGETKFVLLEIAQGGMITTLRTFDDQEAAIRTATTIVDLERRAGWDARHERNPFLIAEILRAGRPVVIPSSRSTIWVREAPHNPTTL